MSKSRVAGAAINESRGVDKDVIYTRHAITRIQQRGIRRPMLQYLLDYGHEEHDHHGGIVVTFDHQVLAMTKKGCCHDAQIKGSVCRSLYAVIAMDGSLITTGHRRRRVKRDRSLRVLRGGSHIRGARRASCLPNVIWPDSGDRDDD